MHAITRRISVHLMAAAFLSSGFLSIACASNPANMGQSFLFERDQTFHYEALRALGYTASGGADVNEIMMAIGSIKSGDIESWYSAWYGLAQRTEVQAAKYTRDKQGQAVMLLKASKVCP